MTWRLEQRGPGKKDWLVSPKLRLFPPSGQVRFVVQGPMPFTTRNVSPGPWSWVPSSHRRSGSSQCEAMGNVQENTRAGETSMVVALSCHFTWVCVLFLAWFQKSAEVLRQAVVEHLVPRDSIVLLLWTLVR